MGHNTVLDLRGPAALTVATVRASSARLINRMDSADRTGGLIVKGMSFGVLCSVQCLLSARSERRAAAGGACSRRPVACGLMWQTL